MTVQDTDDITPPRDPAVFGRRRPGLGVAAIVALCVICVLLGFVGARVTRLLDGDKTPAAPRPVASQSPAPEPSPPAPYAPPLAGQGPSVGPASGNTEAIEARLAQLESGQSRTLNAAAAALAASALADAAQTSQPFEAELSAVERVLPLSADARGLRPLAATGVPSRAVLADEFSAVAARASVEARAPGEGAGLLDRFLYSLSAVVTVRRVGSTTGNGPDAVLARAESQVIEGDLAGALVTLKGLPPKSAQALDAWRARARQRLALDQAVSTIRAQALAELTFSGGGRP
ncbi:MAG: hypothetical protein GC145_02445 [Caulobacter sp.]|nr:hypothetical protein [Caulobacter sp.]